MYKYKLNISVFSENNDLARVIRLAEPCDGFIHTVKMCDRTDTSIISSSDILVWDFSVKVLLELEKYFKKGVKIILLSNEYFKQLGVYDISIVKPNDYDFLEYSFKKILNNIKLEADYNYASTCLNTAINSIPDMAWFKSLDGIHTLLNDEFCKVVSKDKQDITGKDHFYIWGVSPDDPNSGADICKKTEDDVIAAGKTLSFNECVKDNQGRVRQLVTYKSPVYDKNNQIIGTFGIGHDITDLKNMSKENEILFNSMPYPVLIRNNDDVIENINKCFEYYFLVTKDEIVGQNYEDWANKTFGSERYKNEEGYKEAITVIGAQEKRAELRFDNIRDMFGNITGQICIFRDVTLERKLEQQIKQNSYIDFMTGAYNRRYLDEFMSKQDKNSRLSVFSIDLDHFKFVNDTYGHNVGDRAIILTSKILKTSFPDDLVVRMGGDEFIVAIVGDYDLEYLEEKAQRLLKTMNNKFGHIEEFNTLSASIGIANGSLVDNSFYSLLQHGDEALYKAKENRGCYCVYHDKVKKL